MGGTVVCHVGIALSHSSIRDVREGATAVMPVKTGIHEGLGSASTSYKICSYKSDHCSVLELLQQSQAFRIS